MFGKYAARLPFVALALLVFFIFLSSVSEAKLYRWVDKSGTTHLTDFPPADEEAIAPDEEPVPTPTPPKKPAVTPPEHKTKAAQDKTAAPVKQQLNTPPPAPTPTMMPTPPPTPIPVVTPSAAPPAQSVQPSAAPVQGIKPPVKKFPITAKKVTPKSKYALLKNFEIILKKYPLFLTIAPIVIFLSTLFFGYSLFRVAKLLEVPGVLIALIPIVNFYSVVIVSGKPTWWLVLLLFPLTLPFAFTASYMSLAENLGLERQAGLIHAGSYLLLAVGLACIVLLPVSFVFIIIESIFLLLGTLAFFLTPECLIFLSGKKRKQDAMFAERFAVGQYPSEHRAWDDVSDMSTTDLVGAVAGLAASRRTSRNDFSYIDDTVAVYNDYPDEAATLEQTAHPEDEETLTINKGEDLGFEVVEDEVSEDVHRIDSDESTTLKTDDEDYETITNINTTESDSPVDTTLAGDEFKLDDEGGEDFELSTDFDSDLALEMPLDQVDNQKPHDEEEIDLSSSLEIDLGDETQTATEQHSDYNDDKEDFEIKDEDYDYSEDSTIVLDKDIEDFGIDVEETAELPVSEEVNSSTDTEPELGLSLDEEPRLGDSGVITTEEVENASDLDDIPDLGLSLDEEPRLGDSGVITTEEVENAPDLDDIPDLGLSLDEEPRLGDSGVITTVEVESAPDLDDIPDLGLSLDEEPRLGDSGVITTVEVESAPNLDDIPDLELALDEEPRLGDSGVITAEVEVENAPDLDDIPDLELALDEEETVVPSELSYENYDLSLNDPTLEINENNSDHSSELLPDLDIAGIEEITTDDKPAQEDSGIRSKKKGGSSRKPSG